MTKTSLSIVVIGFLVVLAVAARAQVLVFDDPLTSGTTIGVRDNGQGQFVAGQGWKVTSYSDNIRYTPAQPIEDGAVEFDVVGLASSDNNNPDGQLMSMYDASYGNPRIVYAPDLRMNPYKFVWHRYGDDGAQYHEDEFKMILNTQGFNQYEDYSAIGKYPWNPSTKYHLKVRWKDGVVRYYLNGVDTDRWPFVYRGVYKPGTHDIRIATNTRNNAIINAIYSNVKIWDYCTVPTAPFVNNPASGGIVKATSPLVDWTGDRHDKHEVHITSSTSPTTGIIWDSGEVSSTRSYATVSGLSDNATYHAHVRLRNARGWGAWSQPRQFQVSTTATITVPKFAEFELPLTTTNVYANPYTAVTLSATFTGPTKTITVSGFWDGGTLYKFRMMPTETGAWTYTTSSNDNQLNGKTGSFTCVASSNKGYVKVSSAYPYTYEWANGTPFFLLGDTTWHMYYGIRYSDGSFQSLIDARAAQHFNYMHGVMHDSPHNEGGGIYSGQKANPADPDGGVWDCDTLNPAYFQWVDEKIDYMNSKGMVASIFFAWGNEGYGTEYTDAAQWTRYVKYLVARYASKNVIWIVVGEYEEAGQSNATWISYMDTVYNNDPYKHPISMHTVNTTNAFGNTTSHSFVSQQRKGTPTELRSLIASSRIYNKPVVNLEYGYEGDPSMFAANQSADDVRKDHYAICLAGGYGVYGNNVPGYSTYHRTGDFVLTATDTPGARYLSTLYDFFAQTSFWRLVPSQGLVNTGICAAWANNEYVVQLPSGGSVTVNLTGAGGSFYVDWFNPRTGVRTAWSTTTGGASRVFTAPDGNDWILHIHNYVIAPPDGRVTNLSASAGDGQVSLSWTNPSDADFTGTMVRFKTTGYPTGPTDGTLVVDKANAPGSNDSYTHTGLTNEVTYYYSVFAHDSVPTYAAAANTSAAPGSYCFLDAFAYANGQLNGWTGSCSAIEISNQTLKITGGDTSCFVSESVSCSGSGGIIWVWLEIRGGVGGATMWSFYIDDPAARNLARWYGSAGSARARIGGTGTVLDPVSLTGGWDVLGVKIDTNTDTDEFFLNGVSLGTLSHASQSAGNSVGSLRFERTGNVEATGHSLFFDNLRVGSDPPETSTPAAKASADGQVRKLKGKVVSASFSGFFYVQELDRRSGIKVLSSVPVAAGNVVDVAGVLRGQGSERYIDASSGYVYVTAQ